MSLKKGKNEISFVIHRQLGKLKSLLHYKTLLESGFIEETCLTNNPFFLNYLDKERFI